MSTCNLESLTQLRDTLNRIYCEFEPYHLHYLLDQAGLHVTNLPTFGGHAPRRHDAYSWDDRHYLTYDQGAWVIYKRTDHED